MNAPFAVDDLLVHRLNPDLGIGRVERVDGRRVIVYFRTAQQRLTLAATDAALERVPALCPGNDALLDPKGELVRLMAGLDGGRRFRLADGRVVEAARLWPATRTAEPVGRLAALDLDPLPQFQNRLAGLLLEQVRQARGLGSFLGGRLRIFPHQLHVAERAAAEERVRWLLADEVGLGKTIEACLILSRLLRLGRVERVLVVAPATLSVQWLSELWRKFHQTFVLLDEARRRDVAVEFDAGFNPFEAHTRMVVPLEDLAGDPRLARLAAESGLDAVVVDEAHRLERRPGDAGSPAYQAVAPLVRATPHALLLTATPLESDVHGFFRLLELLRPEAYASPEDFAQALEADRPLPPCTSATRRVDIGGVPPRLPLPIELDRPPARMGLSGNDAEDRKDPRVQWLGQEVRRWAPDGDDPGKALVFVHDRATLQALKTRLETAAGRRVAIFHEELPPDRCDLEVAEFRRPEGPCVLISTECGGEGRNFEFCRRLVLFDLPRDPAQVEQRIGRLDRVTRSQPIEVLYFQPPDGFEAELARLYRAIGSFERPLGGLERTLDKLEAEIRKGERLAALGKPLKIEALAAMVSQERERQEQAVFHHLHRDGYRQELGAALLERVPRELDELNERFVLGAAELLGFDHVEKPGARTHYLELGAHALVDSLPGLPGGSRFLGSFDREEAVRREELEFFAAGHPLVEGLLGELNDGLRGRVALFRHGVAAGRSAAFGLVAMVARPGQPAELRACDLLGRERPDWAERTLRQRAALVPLAPAEWRSALGESPVRVAELAQALAGDGRIEALAGVQFGD